MESRALRHFLAVVDHRSVTAAAEALHISQPALTKSIRNLEDNLGVELFERLPNGVVTTRFGQALAKRARLMSLEYQHAIADIAAMKGGHSGTINIGAGPVWLMHYLPPAIAAFHAQQPNMQINVRGGVLDTMLPELLGGETDMLCGSLDFPAHPEVVKEHLFDVEHVMVARHDHPLAGLEEARPEDLLEYPWAMLAGDHIGRSHIGSFFSANGLRPANARLQASSILCILQTVKGSDFLANVPKPMLAYADMMGIVPLAVRGTFWHYEAGVAYRKSTNPFPAVNTMTGIIRSLYSQP
ncbi:LysR family transcriptional regulator [Breoghania sp. L-A4]|uniref:LysR substrate-binding domain-containing protein n=1 Tax=Breoghania sp. L-A4 TaxID=2304600 RepID=UPI000E35C008|nr:LysR family transcriptional regulator [Breoghania sp. L-A4]AXS42167.1 LysR family transcriptional regulator [Breoghania sp. L-A4]